MKTKSEVEITVTEDAAEWLDRLQVQNVAEEVRTGFVDWLLRSPVHVEEFLRLSSLRAELDKTLSRDPEWLGEILASVDSNVIDLSPGREMPIAYDSKNWRGLRGGRYAAVVVIIALLLGTWAIWSGGRDSLEITTALGEQRSLVLADGSVVELNTETRLLVKLSQSERRVDLLQGEAIFQVAKDPMRPFRVRSGDAWVEAIGTRFNIYRQAEQTIVTVVEGRVAVVPEKLEPGVVLVEDSSEALAGGVAATVMELTAGQEVSIRRDGSAAKPAPANVERTTAWTDRRLVFENDTLGQIIAEFNRYNHNHLIIGDQALRERRITGRFDANDIEGFLALISSLEAIDTRVDANGNRIIYLAPRAVRQ